MLVPQDFENLAQIGDRVHRFDAVRRPQRGQLAVLAEHRLQLFDGLFGNHPVERERDLHELVGVARLEVFGTDAGDQARVEFFDIRNRQHFSIAEHRVAAVE